MEREEARGRAAPGAAGQFGALKRAYALLVSPRLAIALLIVILACCVAGVTVVRGARAGTLIFSTPWFNGLLVLLAVSSAVAFFSRTWKRKLTVVSAGMILFHLSFAAMLCGIAYNRLFFFEGVLRLTEGETLPNGRLESYDVAVMGRYFDLATLRGETTLVKLHVNYKVDGENKRAAYEIAVDDGDASVQRIIYVAEYLDFGGVRYFCQKEGYSVLLVMSDASGKEIYGAHVPLQSRKQADGSYWYGTGTPEAAGSIPFPPPPPPERVRAEVMMRYRPNAVLERAGEVAFDVLPLRLDGSPLAQRGGSAPVGGSVDVGAFELSPREIRYWVGMNVRYDPGLKVVLGSLCLGLLGMVLTFVGRVRQGAARARAS